MDSTQRFVEAESISTWVTQPAIVPRRQDTVRCSLFKQKRSFTRDRKEAPAVSRLRGMDGAGASWASRAYVRSSERRGIVVVGSKRRQWRAQQMFRQVWNPCRLSSAIRHVLETQEEMQDNVLVRMRLIPKPRNDEMVCE